jgi:hypothetical protein
MSAQSIRKTKRSRVVTTLGTKLKIITDSEAVKRVVIRNMEADLRCYKEVVIDMKKARI